jgi:eukaryotic-like serine/threonine-protein kinase
LDIGKGSRIGPYEIVDHVGAGGMGDVYRARDTRLDRDVAIKVLPPHVVKDPMARARFEREAKAIAALSHPNVLSIFDLGLAGETPYIVIELLEGETLRERLAPGPLPWRNVLELGAAIADGLAAAHAKDIVHRDLKPENIFLTSDGRVKILDFGLAKPLPKQATAAEDEKTGALGTSPGFVVGTLGYVAPEQLRGKEVDARSDIFGLGCTLYEMLSGRNPFHGDSAVDTLTSLMRDDPDESVLESARIPDDVRLLVRRCLEKNRDLRFQSAKDLAYALRSQLSTTVLRTPTLPLPRVPRRVWRPVLAAAAIALFALVAWRVAGPRGLSIGGRSINSIAVLPFGEAGRPAASDDYLTDGITESLINGLSQLPQLSVMSSTTVFRYKGETLDPLRIGKELRVDALLMGRISRRGESLHVSTELVDAENGRRIWGRQDDVPLSQVAALQTEIARQISDELHLELTGAQKEQLARRQTEDAQAYELYMKGRYAWNKRTPDGLRQAVGFFQQAIDRDPLYARAYAGLADAYILQSAYGQVAPSDVLPRAHAAAARALELDPALAEARTSLAYFRRNYDEELGPSEAEFRRAIAQNPSYATAHHWYALCLADMGRAQDAIREIRTAAQLDPLSPVIYAESAGILNDAGLTPEAVAEIQKALELDRNLPFAHHIFAEIELRRGDAPRAIEEASLSWRLGGDPRALLRLGQAHVLAGDRKSARAVLDQMEALSRERFVSPHTIARLAMVVNEKERALTWLERSQAVLPPGALLRSLKRDPLLAPLLPDPRFDKIVREVTRRLEART